MAPRSPLLTAIGLGQESTAGTAVSRTNWLIPISVTGFVEQYDYKTVELLRPGAGAGPDGSAVLRLNNTVSGRFTIPLMYDGIGLLLQALQMAAVSTTGAGPYTHKYERGTTLYTHTIELIRGDSGNSELLVGCFYPSFKIIAQQGKEILLEVEVVGFKADADRSSEGTPSFTAFAALGSNIAAEDDAADLSWNSGTYAMHRSFTLEVMNGWKLVRKVGSRDGVGAIRVSQGKPRLTIARLEDADTLYNNHRKDDVSGQDAQINLTGTGNLSGVILLRNAKPVSYPPQGIRAGDGIAENVVFEGLQDASDTALLLQLINDSSSGTAN